MVNILASEGQTSLKVTSRRSDALSYAVERA